MLFDRCCLCRRKKKKRCNAAAIIVGIAAFVALVPLAIDRNSKKREWGGASLLVSVTKKTSEHNKALRETTVTLPGIGYIIKSWRRRMRIFNIARATHLAMKKELHDYDDLAIDFDSDGEIELSIQD